MKDERCPPEILQKTIDVQMFATSRTNHVGLETDIPQKIMDVDLYSYRT